MIAARVRFAVFVVLVLILPGGLMTTGEARLIDSGKLAMILSPGLVGLALNRGLGDRGAKARWGWVGVAAAITLAVAAGALAVAMAAGVASFQRTGSAPAAVLSAAGVSALTSVLEELGWAGGGLALALAAFGRRWGVLVLGLVWAAWHLVPGAAAGRPVPSTGNGAARDDRGIRRLLPDLSGTAHRLARAGANMVGGGGRSCGAQYPARWADGCGAGRLRSPRRLAVLSGARRTSVSGAGSSRSASAPPG